MSLDSLEEVTQALHDQGYVSDPNLSMSLFPSESGQWPAYDPQ